LDIVWKLSLESSITAFTPPPFSSDIVLRLVTPSAHLPARPSPDLPQPSPSGGLRGYPKRVRRPCGDFPSIRPPHRIGRWPSAKRVALGTSSYPLTEGRSPHGRYLRRLVVSLGGHAAASGIAVKTAGDRQGVEDRRATLPFGSPPWFHQGVV
jgi:hypothetical protein